MVGMYIDGQHFEPIHTPDLYVFCITHNHGIDGGQVKIQYIWTKGIGGERLGREEGELCVCGGVWRGGWHVDGPNFERMLTHPMHLILPKKQYIYIIFHYVLLLYYINNTISTVMQLIIFQYE